MYGLVSKLFRAYGLYNPTAESLILAKSSGFQSSFELTGYITGIFLALVFIVYKVSKLFRAYGLYNSDTDCPEVDTIKFQSSFELTGYITYALWKVHEY